MYMLGIDIGTTGTKSILIDNNGVIHKTAYKSYEVFKFSNNIVEQKADDWWDAVVSTVKECIKEVNHKDSIKALSISSQGGSTLPVNKKGNPLSNVIVWMDKRGVLQQKDLLKLHSDEFYYKKTGWKLSAGGNLVQIRWLKDNKPELFDKTYKFLSTIDYINYKLTGNYVIDPTNAAMTNLIDIQKGVWDNELLEAAGIREERLPQIVDSGQVIGELTLEAAASLGLSTSTKVVNGGHDQYCSAIGTGTVNDGQIFLSAGTAWVLIGAFKEPIFNTNTYISPGRHIVKDLWGALVSVQTGGISMEWFKNNFGLKVLPENLMNDKVLCDNAKNKGKLNKSLIPESLKEIDRKASTLIKRNENVFFYPYYNGSGYPNYNKHIKASLMGIGLEHDRYDMALAIMEGVAFEINHAIEEFKESGCKLDSIRMIGGGSKSDLWTEIIANVIGVPVIRLKESEAACIGAAIIAGVGCGTFQNYSDGYSLMSKDELVVNFDEAKKDFYKAKYERYRQGIKHIESFFK